MALTLARLCFAATVVATVWLSLTPQENSVQGDHGDKLAHATAYAVLGGLAVLSTRKQRGRLGLLLAVALLGFLLEAVQSTLPERTASLLDGAANLVGIAAGWGIAGYGLARAREAWGGSSP